MTKIFLGLLLIGLLCVSISAGAETTDAPSVQAGEQDLTLTIRPYFGAIGIFASMASEEAFEYILTNDKTLKDEFYADMNASEEAIAACERVDVPEDEYHDVFQKGIDDIKGYVPTMKDAAEKMFASFEETGTPVLEDVKAFEEAGDDLIYAADRIWNESTPDFIPPTAYSRERSLYDYLMRAIEESYAYPATMNSTEKEHALANFAAFDSRIERYESAHPDDSYEGLKLLKQDLMDAALRMYASYETDGAVNQEDLMELEILIEKINDGFRENNQKLS
jgi:hypothetical protein